MSQIKLIVKIFKVYAKINFTLFFIK